MIRRRVVLTLLVLYLCLPGAVTAQSIDTDSIPSSAFAAVLLKPKEALSQPSMELVPREIITAFGQQELGFDPLEIVRLTVLVDSFEDMRQPPGFAVIANFDSPQTISEKITGQMDADQFEGRPIYRTSTDGPVLYLPDDQTMVFGMESFIENMHSSSGVDSPLVSLIEATGSEAEVQAYFVMEPMRELINQSLPPASQVPPPFVDFLELPDLVSSVTTEVSFAEDSWAQLKIQATDPDAANQINEILQQALAMGKQAIMGQIMQEMQNQSPALQRAVVQYINRLEAHLQTHMLPKIEGSDLVFRAEDDSQMVALGSVGVLTGLLLPAVQQVREAARRTDAMNNLRQIALACHNYESAYRHLPGNLVSEEGQPLLSWRVAILPYIEENNLYEQFHLDEPWDSEHNIQLLDQMPEVFQNRNAMLENETVYQGFQGPGTIFEGPKVRFREITDGTSNTIMFVESDIESAVEWSRPADLPFSPDEAVAGIGNLRPNGFNAALVDGSVLFVHESIDWQALRNLIQMNDGNVVRMDEE